MDFIKGGPKISVPMDIVFQGDVLKQKVEKKKNVKNIWKFICKTHVESKLETEADISEILNY